MSNSTLEDKELIERPSFGNISDHYSTADGMQLLGILF